MPEEPHEPELRKEAKAASPPSDEAGLPKAQRIVVACVGMACLIGGGVATFVTTNGAGSATLVGAGVGLLVVAFLGNRIESLRFGNFEAKLRAATLLYGRADDLEADGLDEEAAKLRAQADRLMMHVAPHTRAYEDIRRTEQAGPGRMARLYDIVRAAEQHSREARPTADEVRNLFLRGGEGDRVFALVLMREDPSVADFEAILDVIARSRSAFEQYQALAAAERIVANLDPQSRTRLQEALLKQTGTGGWINPTTDRWPAAQRMLATLTKPGAN